MTPETALKNKIMLRCGELNWICIHANVGRIKLPTGKYFTTGIPKGFPDLIIITTFGRTLHVETKIHPRKPTSDQKRWIGLLRERGYVAEVIYSIEEFNKLVDQVTQNQSLFSVFSVDSVFS